MEDHEEIEEYSSSNMPILVSRGTFIPGTTDGSDTGARYSTKHHRVDVNEDLLNRQIQGYGWVSPERVKNVVWSFLKKYGSKKLKSQDDNLKLSQQDLHTIYLGDPERRRYYTVKLDQDNEVYSLEKKFVV